MLKTLAKYMNSSTKYFNEKNELWGITDWTVRKTYTMLFWKSRYTKILWGGSWYFELF